MIPPMIALAAACLATQPGPPPASDDARVNLPLAHWFALTERAAARPPAPSPPEAVVHVARTIDGRFDKGLLAATLEATFVVHDDQGYLQVPVIDDSASPSQVTLNGEPTSLVARGGMYTVGVERPGTYTVRVAFFRGQEQERFARRLQLRLPAGGVTRVDLTLPEADVDARLEGGAVTASAPSADHPGRTRVVGHLDASGQLDLTWARRVDHAAGADVRLEVAVRTVVTVDEGLVRGLSVVDATLTAGETDRLSLRVPPGVEVLDVSGAPVLQWRSDPDDRARLDVLLRHLIADRAQVAVRFQLPIDDPARVTLATLLPEDGVPFTGSLGVIAPAGLDVEVLDVTGAQATGPRDLPPELTELTSRPLLHGFRFSEAPTVAVAVARHASVAVTSTLVDEVQASTVLLADGAEVTKMRLDIRNNTRQYLRVVLPPGAELTHALLDGHPVRPAAPPRAASDAEAPGEGQDGAAAPGDALLFSLRQSERIDPDHGRVHVVQPNETLGAIAHRYYADPDRWRELLHANHAILRGDPIIRVGQRLQIPGGDLTVEESAFVLELAYRAPGTGPLSGFGRASLALPRLDVDTMKVVWHVYLPSDLEPVDFDANLTQIDGVRLGILQRLRYLVAAALGTPAAHAGGGDYESILSRRKGIYRQEAARKTLAEVTPSSFPLVGQRYRFRRVLDDGAPPRVSVTYLDATAADLARVAAGLLMFALALVALRRRARWWHRGLVALATLALLAGAHHLLGAHRALIWGAIAGALAAIAASLWARRPWRLPAALREPWRLLELATLANLARAVIVLAVVRILIDQAALAPLLLLFALLALWWRLGRPAADPSPPAAAPPPLPPRPTAPPTPEVSHA